MLKLDKQSARPAKNDSDDAGAPDEQIKASRSKGSYSKIVKAFYDDPAADSDVTYHSDDSLPGRRG